MRHSHLGQRYASYTSRKFYDAVSGALVGYEILGLPPEPSCTYHDPSFVPPPPDEPCTTLVDPCAAVRDAGADGK